MEIALLILLLLIGPLALVGGRDSRVDEGSQRHRYVGELPRHPRARGRRA